MKDEKGSLVSESRWCGWSERPNHGEVGGSRMVFANQGVKALK
jgi:hypothetical protein